MRNQKELKLLISVLSLLALMSVVSACGTISGRDEFLSIDSVPRGIPTSAYVGSELEPLAVTPYFLRTRRAFSQTIVLTPPDRDPMEQRIRCSVRWVDSVLGNGLMYFPFGPFGAIAGAGADLLTGAMFACESDITFIVEDMKEKAPRQCRRILVLPPNAEERYISDKIAHFWIRNQLPTLTECDRILPYKEMAAELERYNIDYEHAFEPKSLPRDRVNRVGFTSGATHFALIDTNKKGSEVTLGGRIVDAHTLKETPAPPLQVPGNLGLLMADDKSWTEWLWDQMPNAIRYSPVYSRDLDVSTKRASETEWQESYDRRLLPSYVSTFDFTRVDHPYAHNIWDLSGHIYPSLGTMYFNQIYYLRDLEPPAGQPVLTEYEVKSTALVAAIDFSGTVHVPIGAISGIVGVGGLFGVTSDNVGYSEALAIPVLSWETRYTAFISDNVFFAFSVTMLGRLGGDGESADLFGTDRVSIKPVYTTSFGVGYYLPALKRILSRD